LSVAEFRQDFQFCASVLAGTASAGLLAWL